MQELNYKPISIYLENVSKQIKSIKGEFIRKILHFLIALVPFLAHYDKTLTLFLLATGIIFYTIMEKLRQEGVYVLFISNLTLIASREREKGRFVMGPVTLGLGAMLALCLYPEPVSRIAIYALAFGDGLASLTGKLFGMVKIPFTGGKTIGGTLTCFAAVFLISSRILGNIFEAFLIALVAAALEALPSEDMDNMIMPVGTGIFAMFLLNSGGFS